MAKVSDVQLAFAVADLLREPPAKVRRQLQEIREARQAKGPRKPERSSHAGRTRRYRQRLRQDIQVLTVEVPRVPFAEAMIAAGRITPEASLFRDLLEREASRLLADWATRWKE
jgi:hypothetical protein